MYLEGCYSIYLTIVPQIQIYPSVFCSVMLKLGF